ncbi:MAG: calcium-binding protein [Methylovulum miyakonense]|uniref:calcium-binding protein n=1 Tax=Methylovulum miyakonense TaxID=645578 RepID=UPI003BB7CC74
MKHLANQEQFYGDDFMATLKGDNQNNLLIGSVGNDILAGYGGHDILNGGAGNDLLSGGAGHDILIGGTGNDRLVGGSYADLLIGGEGNDIYMVDYVDDVISETADAGIDTVNSSITWMLGENLEKLYLTGTAVINGTGNALNNTLKGNDAANVLAGGEGNDALMAAWVPTLC